MTSDGPLDERYLEWLYSLIGPVRNRNPARSHWLLIEQLYKKEFVWFVANDDNRIGDALDLREEFISATHAERNRLWLEEGVSVIEMLIALCRRLEFQTRHDAYWWFWQLMDSLGLRVFTDDVFMGDEQVYQVVDEIISNVVDRRYQYNGAGGLFPLRHAEQDQTTVEIWYQMSSYLLENGYV